MKLLFVRPAQIHWRTEAKRVGTPLGILTLASVVRSKHEVALLDVCAEGYGEEEEIAEDVFRFGLSRQEITRRISRFDPDVVAITCPFAMYWRQMLEIAEIVKAVSPVITTVAGGHHPSSCPRKVFALDPKQAIDFIVLGEGERTFSLLIDSLESQECLPSRLTGIAYRQGEDIVIRNTPTTTRPALQWVPNPAWDLLDSTIYSAEMSHFGAPRGKNFADVMLSRGCPVGCSFCTTGRYFGKVMRTRSLTSVSKELNMIASLGWEEVVVEDDNFAALPGSFQKGIAETLATSGLHWNIDGGLYYPLVNDQLVSLLADTGCYRVFLPVESPDLGRMHKSHKYLELDETAQKKTFGNVTRLLDYHNIEFYVAVMLGFPGQTRNDVLTALRLAERAVCDYGAMGAALHWVHPYPGTEFYEASYRHCSPSRRWETAPEYYTFVKPVFELPDIRLDEMEDLVAAALERINGTSTMNTSAFMGSQVSSS